MRKKQDWKPYKGCVSASKIVRLWLDDFAVLSIQADVRGFREKCHNNALSFSFYIINGLQKEINGMEMATAVAIMIGIAMAVAIAIGRVRVCLNLRVL